MVQGAFVIIHDGRDILLADIKVTLKDRNLLSILDLLRKKSGI